MPRFCRWGLGLSPPPLPKMGLNPTSGCCREKLPRKFGGREKGGCFLEGEQRQGRREEEPRGAMEASSKSPFEAGRRGSIEGGCGKRGWGVWASGHLQKPVAMASVGLCPHPLPPCLPPRFWLSPTALTRFSCPSRVSAVSRQHWHEGRWR